VLVNDPKPECLVHKYIDDTTLTELLYDRTKHSSMHSLIFHQQCSIGLIRIFLLTSPKLKKWFFGPISASSYHAQLLHFYISVIRPVLEYAVHVWHHLLTKTQSDSIESVQKRARRIIYSFSNDIPCCNSLDVTDIASLSTRRNELSRKFFIP